ncbi:thyrostimulin alpha-2 subunit-like [Diadema antillarum]|uniref:thyrostimulin alpha-2 subunit-like n=1 Tax=Diadema antillarum TaxID=105358 RepID=UPI003A8C3575
MRPEVLVFYASFLAYAMSPSAVARKTMSWQRPGCHLVGFTKKVEIPGCYVEMVPMNACKGYCNSYSYPSDLVTLLSSGGQHEFTTYGRCCSIKDTHKVDVILECENYTRRIVTFKSAAECQCSLCNIEND